MRARVTSGTRVRARPTARLRMRQHCSNSADLAGFRNQLVYKGRASLETGTIGIYIFWFKLFPLCLFVAMACGIRIVVCIIISME